MAVRAHLWDLLRRAQGIVRLERGLAQLSAQVQANTGEEAERLADRLAALEERIAAVDARAAGIDELLRGPFRAVLRALVSADAENRRRLWAARAEPDYERAFTDADPLVSVVIPTQGRVETLISRSLASVLASSHARIEVIVIGDHSGPEVEAAIAALGEPRVRFHNLSQRLPIAGSAQARWQVGSVMARNEGFRLARGAWRLAFDDDDHLYPDAIERLLAAARESRAEVSYGRFRQQWPEGLAERGAFPPAIGEFTWQCGLVHGALRFFERDLSAAAFEEPNDIFMAEAMLRAGVRFAMIPELVCDLYPAGWQADP